MATPAHIGRYPVKQLLGSGAMGNVYLAHDMELDRAVAIKTVHPRLVEHADSGDILERLRNEARAVARVRHPSIVEVYDVGKDASAGPFLVFEYVEGRNLKQILREHGPLGPGLVIAVAEHIGEALARAHSAGIIHRDIKPENLLVGGDGRTRLLDFGVARLPDAVLTGEGQFLGTPAYSAPETLSKGVYGPASDQFSLAAVLFEAITGRRPFSGDEAIAVAHAVVHDNPPAPSECAPLGVKVPRAVDAVILRGLSKSEADRFPDVPSLVRALRAAYQGHIPSLPPSLAETLPERPGEPRPRRSRWLAWAWGLTGAALLAGAAMVLRFVPRAGAPEGDDGVALTAIAADAATADGAPLDAGAGADAQLPGDADAADAGEGGADAAPDVLQLTPFEREERAKDALDRARTALQRRDYVAAEGALREAEQYDPRHPDIAVLRRQLPPTQP